MSAKPAKKKIELGDLTPDAKGIVESRIYQGQKPFKEARRLLAELSRFDNQTDTLAASAGKMGCIFGILAVVLLFAIIFVAQTGLIALIGADLALVAVFTIVALLYYRRYKAYKKVDLQNDFKKALLPLLDELGEDVDSKTPVTMKLDLAGLTDKKIIKKEKLPPGRFKEVNKTVYQDPWCHLTLELADGNKIALAIKNYFIRIDRRWTNPRGKSKSKAKWQKRVVVSAQLYPDEAGAGWDQSKFKAGAMQKMKLLDRKGSKVCRVVQKYKFKTVNEEPKETPPVPEMLGLLVQLYAMMTPVEQRS